MPFKIHAHGAGDQHRLVEVFLDVPAHGRPDAGKQLPGLVRLCHIIVSAQLKTNHNVNLGILGREHDDRHRRARAYLAADLGARNPGQHEVEQNEVCTDSIELGDGGRTVLGHLHLVPLPFE